MGLTRKGGLVKAGRANESAKGQAAPPRPEPERSDDLLEWLGRNDALTLGERLERLHFLVRLNEEYAAAWASFHQQAHEYLEYAARCYLEGLYVPCIIMCQTAVEEQMRGHLRSLALEELACSPMSDILRDRRVRSAFSRPLVRRLEVLRGRRNIYIHPPGPLDLDGYLDSRWLPHRMAAQKKEAEEIYADDARAALRTAAVFFGALPEMGVVKEGRSA